MPAAELAEMGHTAVDACAAAFIRARNLEAVILNGFFPDRIVACVLGRPVLGTLVKKHGRGPPARRPLGGSPLTRGQPGRRTGQGWDSGSSSPPARMSGAGAPTTRRT